MPSLNLEHVQRLCKWSTMTLGMLCILVIVAAFVSPGNNVQALIMRDPKKAMPWRIYEADEVERGVVVPQDTNIVFHLPLNMGETSLDVLLGHRGKDVLYWGYCYPQNYDPKTVAKRQGLPGLLFLSEKERAIRAEREATHAAAFSPHNLPTKQDLEPASQPKSIIRHQLDTLSAGMLCYLQTANTLTLGPDADGDGLNAALEREIGTSPETPDSDGDGIWDGTEKLIGKSNPLLRDTDSDGLVDGVEDRDWDGHVDKGETNPNNFDSDRDGLPDGNMRKKLGNGQNFYLGEDLNLNGKLDSGETDPTKQDTDNDGISDYIEKVNCLLKPGTQGC